MVERLFAGKPVWRGRDEGCDTTRVKNVCAYVNVQGV